MVFFVKLNNDIAPLECTSDTAERIKAFSDSDKVDIFNKYFSSASDVDDTYQKLSQLNNKHYFSFSNIIIDEQEIKDILSLLPVYNAKDPDAICHMAC